MEKVKGIFTSIPYWIYDGISLISGFLTILSFLATIVISLLNVFIQKKNGNTVTFSINPILISLCIVFFLFSLICFLRILKYGTAIRKTKKTFSNNYYNFLHDFRNAYFDILKAKTQPGNTYTIDGLTRDTKAFLEKGLNYLCDIMKDTTGEEVSACIKLIEPAQKINKENCKIFTFCRSVNSNKDRKNNDTQAVLLKKNTDFKKVLDDGFSFYQGDLVKYDESLKKIDEKYENTNDKWKKYYRATIVSPIRVLNSKLNDKNSEEVYDTVGFLCIDSMSTKAFREDDIHKDINTDIVKSFAAEIYVILNKYNYYSKVLKSEA